MNKYYVSYRELVCKFINGATEGLSGGSGHNRNLRIEGDLLIHYETVIAERKGSKVFINSTHYSLQSSKVQKILRETVAEKNQILVYGVERGFNKKLSLIK